MVCTKCGKSIEKGRKYCGFCGAEVSENESISSKRHTILLAVISVIAVLFITLVVIIMCVDLFSNHNSCTTVIEKELDAIQEIDANEYMEILPKEYINYTLETNKNYNKYDDMVLDCEDKLWQENRSNKKKYGTDFKIVYEVQSEVLYKDDKDLSELTEKYNNKYDSTAKIEGAAKATVITEVKAADAVGNSTISEMCFIKIDGTWYLDIDNITNLLAE